jgi:hypothetical protein
VHNGFFSNGWGSDGSVTFGENSGWWLGMSIESFNGVYGSGQGDMREFFSATGFGGESYSNTPVGFVGHTNEPYLGGVSSYYYAALWARGWTAAEAAWAGRVTHHFLHVGDPLVTR